MSSNHPVTSTAPVQHQCAHGCGVYSELAWCPEQSPFDFFCLLDGIILCLRFFPKTQDMMRLDNGKIYDGEFWLDIWKEAMELRYVGEKRSVMVGKIKVSMRVFWWMGCVAKDNIWKAPGVFGGYMVPNKELKHMGETLDVAKAGEDGTSAAWWGNEDDLRAWIEGHRASISD